MILSFFRRASFSRVALVALFASLLLVLPHRQVQAQSVASGSGIYNTSGAGGYPQCSNCHTGPTSSGAHLASSNAFSYLKTSLSPGGNMYIQMGGTPGLPTDTQIMSLALYIGQFKAPLFSVANGHASLTMAVRSGAAGTKDIYPLLQTDGSSGAAQDSGGLSKTNGSNGTVSVAQAAATTAMNYNASYTSTAGYTGSDSFTVTVTNPSGSDTRTIAVTVLGINSATTVTGFKDQAYAAGSPIYQVTSNDGTASNFTATGLPTGLAIDSTTGKITGTPTVTGSFTVTMGADINGAINNGTVNKTLTMQIAGITNSTTASYTQNVAIGTLQITSFPGSPTAYGVTGTLPPGLSFNSVNGQITGTPTTSGSYPITLQATTTAGAVSQGLMITVASAGVPVITSTPALAASPTATVVGTVGTAIATHQINASNPPINAGSYNATGLPPGLSVNATTGAITGTPTTAGDYPVTLSAANVSGTGSLLVVMRISAAPVPTPVTDPISLRPSLPALPGVGTQPPTVLDLSSGQGPTMVACLMDSVRTLLGVADATYLGQTANGVARVTLSGGRALAFYPLQANTNTSLGNSAQFGGSNVLTVGTRCGSFSVTPALFNIGDFITAVAKLGVNANVNITPQGVMTLVVGDTVYVARPDYIVTAGTPGTTATPSLARGADGLYRLTDSSGNVQVLYPAFLDTDALAAQAPLALNLVGTTTIQTDGTALFRALSGQTLSLVPDLTLTPAPAENAGRLWWSGGGNRYLFRGTTQVQAQGFGSLGTR